MAPRKGILTQPAAFSTSLLDARPTALHSPELPLDTVSFDLPGLRSGIDAYCINDETLTPDMGDEATFNSEHDDQGDQQHLLGLTPTHAATVIAFCSSSVDHVVTALLTTAIIDLTAGIAHAELAANHMVTLTGLPKVIAVTPGP
ncbi:DUF6368 family protein [Streptomyces sp. NPDC054855]